MNTALIKLISKENGQPIPDMTDEQWQIFFDLLKLGTKESVMKKMKACHRSMFVNSYDSIDSPIYYGETQWNNYCTFINDVLTTIRSGESDYCYFIYQIVDLLRFERIRLQATWLPEYQCFQVYLKNKAE